MIAPLPTSASDRTASQSESDQENQSKLRFLSLLRRINELRSQQVDVSFGVSAFGFLFSFSLTFRLGYSVYSRRTGMDSHTLRSSRFQRLNTRCARRETTRSKTPTNRRSTIRCECDFLRGIAYGIADLSTECLFSFNQTVARFATRSTLRKKKCERSHAFTFIIANASTSGSCITAFAQFASTSLRFIEKLKVLRPQLSLCVHMKG